MPDTTNLDLSTRPSAYPTIVYQDDIVTVPIHPNTLEEVIGELQETLTDKTITRSYLEQIIAEHQSECILGHHTLDFIDHIQNKTDGFTAGYTDSYVYLIVDKHGVWGGEAEWMPWDTDDEYLLTTAYTREVLSIGKLNQSDWAIEGLDISNQAGYIVPVPFPLHSISEEPNIDTDPLVLAREAETLTSQTVLQPTTADCLVLLNAVNKPLKKAVSTTAHLLGVGVSEIQTMINEANNAEKQAYQTTEQLTQFDFIN